MIKAGNWVNVIINVEDGKVVHNRIAKCHHVWNGLVYYFNGDRIVYAIEENVEKLPIKFKGFDIVDGKIETTKRYSKLYKQTLFFIYDETIHLAMIIGINFIGLWKFVDTPEEARDWLELQYATMIAKARGLV